MLQRFARLRVGLNRVHAPKRIVLSTSSSFQLPSQNRYFSSAPEETKEEEEEVVVEAAAETVDEFAEDPVEPGFIEKYQLTDWTRWLPISVVGIGGATATGIYHWNEESHIAGLFILFVGMVYAKGGDAIGKMFDDTKYSILKDQNDAEDKVIDSARTLLDAHKDLTNASADVQFMKAAYADLSKHLVNGSTSELQHMFRDNTVAKLEALIAMQRQKKEDLFASVVAEATESTRASFMGDEGKALRDAALANAFETLVDPASAKSVVADTYNSQLATEQARRNDLEGTERVLTAAEREKMEDNMKAICAKFNIPLDHMPEVPAKTVWKF